MPREPSLLEAFYLTPEFTTLVTLFNRAGVPLPSQYVIEVIAEGDWSLIEQFTQEQKLSQDLSPLRLKNLLSGYIRCRSVLAAKILLEWDRDFILKKLDDHDLMVFLDLFSTKTAVLDTFLREIITSPRSDAIWKKAAEKLYAFSDLPCPEPYDHPMTLQTFAPKLQQDRLALQQQVAAPPAAVPAKGKRTHMVQSGENLWKIARKYKVSIDALKKANQLETDKLRPGKELVIP
jgi:LysM repeat protein